MPRLCRAEVIEHERIGQESAELVADRWREDGPRRGDDREARWLVAARLERVGERAGHGVADERDGRHALALDEPPDLVGVEALARLKDELAAGEEANKAAPLSRAVNERGGRQHVHREALGERVLGELLGPRDGVAPRRAALETREEHVLLPPHDALGHPGRAARIDDVEVVAAALGEVARGRSGRDRRLEVEAFFGVPALPNDEPGLQGRQVHGGRLRHGQELRFGHKRDEIGVVEEIPQLMGDVAVVHVDGHRPQLERGQQGDHELHAIVEVQAHMRSRPDALGAQESGEPICPLVELPKGQPLSRSDQRVPLADHVNEALEKIREVELHQGFSAPTIHIAKNCDPPPYAWPSALRTPSI